LRTTALENIKDKGLKNDFLLIMTTARQVFVSSGQFHQHLRAHLRQCSSDKKTQTLNVNTKKLHTKLSYKKDARKILVKLTHESWKFTFTFVSALSFHVIVKEQFY
jgi:hypothetical protein